MNYFTIEISEDGDVYFYMYTKEEFLDEINERLGDGEEIEFATAKEVRLMSGDLMGSYRGKIIAIAGEVIIPKAKNVVKKFIIEEEES